MDKFDLYSSMVMKTDSESDDETDIIHRDMMAMIKDLKCHIEVLENERETFYLANQIQQKD